MIVGLTVKTHCYTTHTSILLCTGVKDIAEWPQFKLQLVRTNSTKSNVFFITSTHAFFILWPHPMFSKKKYKIKNNYLLRHVVSLRYLTLLIFLIANQ